jgi:hypothetical protein
MLPIAKFPLAFPRVTVRWPWNLSGQYLFIVLQIRGSRRHNSGCPGFSSSVRSKELRYNTDPFISMQTPGWTKSAWCRKGNTRIDGRNPNGYVRSREDLQDLKGPGFCQYHRCMSGLRPASMRSAKSCAPQESRNSPQKSAWRVQTCCEPSIRATIQPRQRSTAFCVPSGSS